MFLHGVTEQLHSTSEVCYRPTHLYCRLAYPLVSFKPIPRKSRLFVAGPWAEYFWINCRRVEHLGDMHFEFYTSFCMNIAAWCYARAAYAAVRRPSVCISVCHVRIVTKVADSPAKVTEELVQTVDVCDEDETSRGTLQIKLYTFYIVTATR